MHVEYRESLHGCICQKDDFAILSKLWVHTSGFCSLLPPHIFPTLYIKSQLHWTPSLIFLLYWIWPCFSFQYIFYCTFNSSSPPNGKQVSKNLILMWATWAYYSIHLFLIVYAWTVSFSFVSKRIFFQEEEKIGLHCYWKCTVYLKLGNFSSANSMHF